MKIVIAGPPKTGNVWVENILAHAYGLTILKPPYIPSRSEEELEAFCEAGNFLDNSIFHQHFAPTDLFFEIASRAGCHLVTAIRDPYDTFVSLYFYIQRFREDFLRVGDPGAAIIDLAIDHPTVLDFLRHGFRANLESAQEWLSAGRSIVVRYEDLHADPVREIDRVTAQIQPIADDIVKAAINASDVNVLRNKNEDLAKHIRVGKAGDWRNYLTDEHLHIFREYHRDIIEYLGYCVVDDDLCRATLRDIVLSELPSNSTLLVVSKGDERLVSIAPRSVWHFPRSEDGLYAGYYPADSIEAIIHLESLRKEGCGFLMFPRMAMWWLDYYVGFRDHLDRNYKKVFRSADAIIYDMREKARLHGAMAYGLELSYDSDQRL
jgi:hypothetical protein